MLRILAVLFLTLLASNQAFAQSGSDPEPDGQPTLFLHLVKPPLSVDELAKLYELVYVARDWYNQLYVDKDFAGIEQELNYWREQVDTEKGALMYSDLITWLGIFIADRMGADLDVIEEWKAFSPDSYYATFVESGKHLAYWKYVTEHGGEPVDGMDPAESLAISRRLLDEVFAIAPDDQEVANGRLLNAIWIDQDEDEVKQIYQETIENCPNHIWAYGHYANFYLSKGNLDEVDATAKAALSLRSTHPLIALKIVPAAALLARMEFGDYTDENSEVRKAFDEVLDLASSHYPDELRIRVVAVHYYWNVAMPAKAFQHIEAMGNRYAADITPLPLEHFHALVGFCAQQYAEILLHDEQRKYLEIAIEHVPDHAESLELAAEYCDAEGRPKEAAMLREKIEPATPETELSLEDIVEILTDPASEMSSQEIEDLLDALDLSDEERAEVYRMIDEINPKK